MTGIEQTMFHFCTPHVNSGERTPAEWEPIRRKMADQPASKRATQYASACHATSSFVFRKPYLAVTISLFFALEAVLLSSKPQAPARNRQLHYFFEDYALDTDRRELLRGTGMVAVEPQVFDLLLYLIKNREHVVSKDDLLASVWQGRIVSESALSTRINAARFALGDNGEEQRQRLILAMRNAGVPE